MEDILSSKILEYEKSTFLIDLVKHKSGTVYVNIKQNIEGSFTQSEIKINPSILSDLVVVLSNLKDEINSDVRIDTDSFFSPEKQKSVIERYFKGVPIQDLTIQFDCSKQIIEQILMNNKIEIMDNTLPKNNNRKRFFRRKK